MSKRLPWLNYFVVIGLLVRFASSAEAQDARLNTDGSLDNSYTPAIDNIAVTLASQPDGKLLVGGAFTAVNGVSRNSISRLNDDGSLDPTFNPGAGPNKGVSVIALQSDGRILIGGTFATFNGISRARAAGSAWRVPWTPPAAPALALARMAPDKNPVCAASLFRRTARYWSAAASTRSTESDRIILRACSPTTEERSSLKTPASAWTRMAAAH